MAFAEVLITAGKADEYRGEKNYVDFDKNQRSYGIAVRKLIESEGPN